VFVDPFRLEKQITIFCLVGQSVNGEEEREESIFGWAGYGSCVWSC
jgi:hypothetical protein